MRAWMLAIAVCLAILPLDAAQGFGRKRTPPRPPAEQERPAPTTLKVLTYNIWGLPSPAEHAPWRYGEIATRLEPYDVIAFQEAWSTKTRVVLESKSHPYHAFGGYPHGLIGGSGLMVVSRYPIVMSRFLSYDDCSEWECPADKGVLFFRVRLGPGVEIDFYQTHLNAWEEHDLVRTSQILQLVGMVQDYSFDRPIIIMGDFNSDYRSINYYEVVGNLMLRDAYEDRGAAPGFTFDVFANPWAAPELSNEHRPQRLDYVLYRDNGAVRLAATEATLAFRDAVRDAKPLSDHYGVAATFRVQSR